MFLFNRRTHLQAGRSREAQAWAAQITEKVNEVSGLPVSLYTEVFGNEVGLLVWSTFVGDLATLEAANQRLQASDAFVDLSDAGLQFTRGAAEDGLVRLVHGEPSIGREINYVTAVQAVCAPRNLARGMTVGIEIAQMAEKITGVPTMFVNGVTGPYGGVGWLTGFTTVAELQAQQETLGANAEWVELLDREAGTAYQDAPDHTQARIYRRVM
jgi:hypothetical protein